MIEDFKFLTELYAEIYDWITTHTPGKHRGISVFEYYNKQVWDKIRNKFVELESKKSLSKIEQEFLKCRYVGIAYRVMEYCPRKKGYIYTNCLYQSCCKNLDAVKKINVLGDRILIKLKTTKQIYAIDIFELLIFMLKHQLINKQDILQRRLEQLLMYEEEKEIVVPILKNSIINVFIVNSEFKVLKEINSEQWFRDKI